MQWEWVQSGVCKSSFLSTSHVRMHFWQWQFIIGNLDLLNSLRDKYYWFWVIVAYTAANNAINCIFAVNLLPIRWLVIMINVCKHFATIAYKLSAILVSILNVKRNGERKHMHAESEQRKTTLINRISVHISVFRRFKLMLSEIFLIARISFFFRSRFYSFTRIARTHTHIVAKHKKLISDYIYKQFLLHSIVTCVWATLNSIILWQCRD